MKRLRNAGIVLGLGIAGLFDGIMLHQILGWHHMVCTTPNCQPLSVAQLKYQNTLDGFFHFACWILILVGLALLSRAVRDRVTVWSGKSLAGAILIGCGLFNFVEGIVGHQILGLHHVLPNDPHQFLYDLLFLASGIVIALIGWFMGRLADPTVVV
jgi:uncharacterized membrane protein